jgi:pimeloyl-ACP methyl ester carboxylesterase
MPKAQANGIEIEWEAFGDADAEPLLLVMGLGAQMILWDEVFCERLAERGFRVIRFDNRDVGGSTWLDELGVPKPFEAAAAVARGETPEVPYTLHDMADDTAALLEALGHTAAHVVGASMGGMIAQTLSIRHPHRVRSLVSIMSTTGHPSLPAATPEAMEVLTTQGPADREGHVAHTLRASRVIGSPGFPFDEARIRRRAERTWERGVHPEGIARQLAAILGSGHRRDALGQVRVPTLVVHGDADPLVRLEAGLDTARAVPESELDVVEGMGHDLPEPVWERILDGIARTAARTR